MGYGRKCCMISSYAYEINKMEITKSRKYNNLIICEVFEKKTESAPPKYKYALRWRMMPSKRQTKKEENFTGLLCDIDPPM